MKIQKSPLYAVLCCAALAEGCGTAEDETPEITTLDEARIVDVGTFTATSALDIEVVSYVKDADKETTVSRAEGLCPGGRGTAIFEQVSVITQASATLEITRTYDDCVVSEELTLSGSVTMTIVQSADKKWTGTRTGALETSLGVCTIDLSLEGEGDIAPLSETGTLCGLPFEKLQ